MKRLKLLWLLAGLCGGFACGGEPPAVETKEAAFSEGPLYQTRVGHNIAEMTTTYSCDGWVYRLLFSWEQHRDPASPTGWYGAIGPSSVAATGTYLNDVSADVYLNCGRGILPVTSGTFADGRTFSNRVYADTSGSPVPCTLTTVWPASWHAPNPTIPVMLVQYDYTPTDSNQNIAISPNGFIYLDIESSPLWGPGPHPGLGWCGRMWVGGPVTNLERLPAPTPPPPLPICDGSLYSYYVTGCAVAPPCNGLSGDALRACLQPPPRPI